MDAMTGNEGPELGSGALREALEKIIQDMGFLAAYAERTRDGVAPDAIRMWASQLAALSLSSPIEPAPVVAGATTLETLRALAGSVSPAAQASPEIREALAELFELVESGELVRDISRDGEGDWLRRMVKLTATLKKAQAALAPSRPGAAKRVEG